jgi:hypothetical protein
MRLSRYLAICLTLEKRDLRKRAGRKVSFRETDFSGPGAGRYGLSTRLSFVTHKDRVVRAALFQAPAHTLYLNGEPALAQAPFEFSILSGRPDG